MGQVEKHIGRQGKPTGNTSVLSGREGLTGEASGYCHTVASLLSM